MFKGIHILVCIFENSWSVDIGKAIATDFGTRPTVAQFMPEE